MIEFQKTTNDQDVYPQYSEAFEEIYIQWLYSKVGSQDKEYRHYWRVIRRLYRKEFCVVVPNDANRYEDGIFLRTQFADDYGYNAESVAKIFKDKPCTVLEMLVAFAKRIDSDVMWDPEKGDRSAFWFWQMLQNAGLDMKRFSDEYFDKDCLIELDKLINRVVSRRYSRSGEGGFFPIFHTRKNFQRMELWYQMHYWIQENYPI